MLKKLLLFCSIVVMFTACASKTEPEPVKADDAFRKALENATNACAEIAFEQTKIKVGEADTAKLQGNKEAADKAEMEAMEAFKIEEPAYNTLNNANEAQGAQINEVAARRDAMANDAMAANPQAWEETLAGVNEHLAHAQTAYEKCDPALVQDELAQANALLDQMEQVIANTVVVTTDVAVVESGAMYTVQKGDCLWFIAEKQYANPFMWPIIYWANQGQIKDPDLIFPGQNFEIVFNFAEEERVKADNFAKTRGAWTLYDNK